MASSSSSSACRLQPQWIYEYDVFVTFFGKDTRNNFLSHLFAAFRRESVNVFSDERLKRGEEIMPNLLKAIEVSKISVILFSKRYAFSSWCMEELVRIMECQKEYQIVIPVFYKVLLSDVRCQERSFGKAFAEHERNLMPRLDKWKDVLVEASNLTRWDSKVTRPEATLVEEIVNDIVKKLESIADTMVKELELLFASLCDKLDSLASSFWNNIELKQLYHRLKDVHFLLQNAERYRSYRYWLLCPLFTDLKNLTSDVHVLMADYQDPDTQPRRFNQAVKKIDQRLLHFLDSVNNLAAFHHRGRSPIFQQPLPRTVSAENNPSQNLSSCNSKFKEAVFKLEIDDDEAQKKAFKIVSKFGGIKSIKFGTDDSKMTIEGCNLDTIAIGKKLRKLCHTELVFLGSAKMPAEGEQHREEPNIKEEPESHAVAELVKAKKASKLPISFLSRMCISIK